MLLLLRIFYYTVQRFFRVKKSGLRSTYLVHLKARVWKRVHAHGQWSRKEYMVGWSALLTIRISFFHHG